MYKCDTCSSVGMVKVIKGETPYERTIYICPSCEAQEVERHRLYSLHERYIANENGIEVNIFRFVKDEEIG